MPAMIRYFDHWATVALVQVPSLHVGEVSSLGEGGASSSVVLFTCPRLTQNDEVCHFFSPRVAFECAI
ncbi:hypothetical protein TNCV_4497971 [Trichonephila clavipes]|nr:hypothetical protein TNCV_4497971 [Trichonephila clavipes]